MVKPELPRTIIKVNGGDAQGFLQNLVTNDVGDPPITYAALLTQQGKYLADFFIVKSEDGYLVDVATAIAPGFIQRLLMYRLRADVTIEVTVLDVALGFGDAPVKAVSDPRHPAMGWRLYDASSHADFDWAQLRVEHLIPETGIELTPDTYILEAGFEYLNGVDFKKGCYVGQEVTARMKHKTELKKGLCRLVISGSAPAGNQIEKDGKLVGTLFTQSNGFAIAHVRFDRITPGMTAGGADLNPV